MKFVIMNLDINEIDHNTLLFLILNNYLMLNFPFSVQLYIIVVFKTINICTQSITFY